MSHIHEEELDNDIDMTCLRCKQNQSLLLQLQCEHKFCLMCVTFFYIKFKKEVRNENQVKCILCDVVSTLSNEELDLMREALNTRVIPLVSQENNFSTENKHPRSKRNSSHTSNQHFQTIDKKMRSEEHSIQNITPSTKYFFSKCESPSNQLNNFNTDKHKDYCSYHNRNEANFVCFTCNNSLLCLKCVRNREHQHHDLQNLRKGVECLTEQISLCKLETTQKIECIQMWQRRLQHSKNILQDRAQKSVQEVQKSFKRLQNQLLQKQAQVLDSCRSHYENLLRYVNEEGFRISQQLGKLKNYQDKLTGIMKLTSPQQFVGEYNRIKDYISDEIIKAMEPKILQKLSFEETPMNKQMHQIEQCINRIRIDFRPSQDLNNKIAKSALQKSKSDKKIKHQETSKRVKTNFASLNSSRDKRDVKCAKTQEDETRFKNKAHLKQISRGNSKQLPSYITKFFDKQILKQGGNGMSCVYDFQPQVCNSKTSSKLLSKTVVPEEGEMRKRKDQRSIPKDRIERRTVNTMQSKMLKPENHKKKKVHC